MAERSTVIPRQRRIQRIQLEPYDDVTSVRDRLQFVKAGRVLLVFPKNRKILQRKLDLVLLQREAARRDLRLAIVTQDIKISEHARDLNISAFFSVEQARTQRWKRGKTKVFVDRADRPESEHDPYDLMLAASRLKPAPTSAQQARGRVMRGFVFGVTILAVLFGLYALVPSATITITPARDQLNITIPIVADPSIEVPIPENLRIPATVQRLPQSATVTMETTGIRAAENSRAEGIVTFTNTTDFAIFIPAGTIVQTASSPPIQFETQAEGALAARQDATVNVAIRSLDTNPTLQSNQPAGAIIEVAGELEGSVTVRNQNATYGEGVRDISYVTAEDREILLQRTRQQLAHNARDTFLLNLEEGEFFLVPNSVVIIEERILDYSAEVDQPAETIRLTMQAVVEATVISSLDAERVAWQYLKTQYVEEGRILDEGTLTYTRAEIQGVLEDGSVAFQLRIQGTTFDTIDGNQIKDRLTGMSVREAYAILDNEYILDPQRPPEISTWPGFFNRMPLFPSRIHVEIEGE
jgi:hypothetical protein